MVAAFGGRRARAACVARSRRRRSAGPRSSAVRRRTSWRSSCSSPRTSTSGSCPTLITLPMIPLALAFAISGQNPFVGGAWPAVAGGGTRDPGGRCTCRRCCSGPGAFGLGDVKLLVSVGLMSRGLPGDPRHGRRDHRGRHRDRRPRSRAPGHAQDLHPVRAVPDPGRPVGPRCSARDELEGRAGPGGV